DRLRLAKDEQACRSLGCAAIRPCQTSVDGAEDPAVVGQGERDRGIDKPGIRDTSGANPCKRQSAVSRSVEPVYGRAQPEGRIAKGHVMDAVRCVAPTHTAVAGDGETVVANGVPEIGRKEAHIVS